MRVRYPIPEEQLPTQFRNRSVRMKYLLLPQQGPSQPSAACCSARCVSSQSIGNSVRGSIDNRRQPPEGRQNGLVVLLREPNVLGRGEEAFLLQSLLLAFLLRFSCRGEMFLATTKTNTIALTAAGLFWHIPERGQSRGQWVNL